MFCYIEDMSTTHETTPYIVHMICGPDRQLADFPTEAEARNHARKFIASTLASGKAYAEWCAANNRPMMRGAGTDFPEYDITLGDELVERFDAEFDTL